MKLERNHFYQNSYSTIPEYKKYVLDYGTFHTMRDIKIKAYVQYI